MFNSNLLRSLPFYKATVCCNSINFHTTFIRKVPFEIGSQSANIYARIQTSQIPLKLKGAWTVGEIVGIKVGKSFEFDAICILDVQLVGWYFKYGQTWPRVYSAENVPKFEVIKIEKIRITKQKTETVDSFDCMHLGWKSSSQRVVFVSRIVHMRHHFIFACLPTLVGGNFKAGRYEFVRGA